MKTGNSWETLSEDESRMAPDSVLTDICLDFFIVIAEFRHDFKGEKVKQ